MLIAGRSRRPARQGSSWAGGGGVIDVVFFCHVPWAVVTAALLGRRLNAAWVTPWCSVLLR